MLNSVTSEREKAALLALVEAAKAPWHAVADLVEDAGSALSVIEGRFKTDDPNQIGLLNRIGTLSALPDIERWLDTINALRRASPDVRLITVLDDDYPRNLRLVFNRPPFLFVKGRIDSADERAVAMVGTRAPSQAGLKQASSLAKALAIHGVTIISGLARGIDGAAHEATLAAGGRTLAVMGTGINKVYPAEHQDLADRIVSSGGALISQFWPDSPPIASNFPLRNVVMSGIAMGTVVIEASSTSGAKMQARLALEHSKKLFLVERLVTQQDWAKRYATRPGVQVVGRASEILESLRISAEPASQLQIA